MSTAPSGAANRKANAGVSPNSSAAAAAAGGSARPFHRSTSGDAFSSASAGGLEVTVSDPEKQGDGLVSAYVSYRVNTKVSGEAQRAQFDYDQYTVIRRYSDFVWLRDELERAWPGVIVPPLPDKMVVGRFSDEFVEQRRRSLERFLKKVAGHQMLRDSPALRTFLEASEEAFARIRAGNEYGRTGGLLGGVATLDSVLRQATGVSTSGSTSSGLHAGGAGSSSGAGMAGSQAGAPGGLLSGFFEWASESATTLTTALTGGPAGISGGASLRERTPDDDRFDEAARYVDALDPHVDKVSRVGVELVSRERSLSAGLFDFGLAFTLLGQQEQGSLGNALTKLGACTDALSKMSAELSEQEQLLFVEPTKDFVRVLHAAKHALEVRTQKRVAYENALADVANKKWNRARFAGQPMTSSRDTERLAQADQEIARAESRLEGAKEEFDVVTKRVLIEIERFKREKLVDFKAVILDFVQLQIEHHKRAEREWRDVLPELQAIDAGAQRASEPPASSPGAPPPASSSSEGLSDLNEENDASAAGTNGGAKSSARAAKGNLG